MTPTRLGNSRRHLRRALDASLTRLGLDHVDLYQLHAWDSHTPLEETLRFLGRCGAGRQDRLLRLSNFTGWQVQKAVDLAEREHLAVPVTLQPSLQPAGAPGRVRDRPSVPAQRPGSAALGPLGGGWLSGKYTRDERPTGATRLGENPDRGIESYDKVGARARTWDVLEASEYRRGQGASMPQVALAWLMARPTVSSVILAGRTVAQLRDNLGAAHLTLTAEEMLTSTPSAIPARRTTPTERLASNSAAAACPADPPVAPCHRASARGDSAALATRRRGRLGGAGGSAARATQPVYGFADTISTVASRPFGIA